VPPVEPDRLGDHLADRARLVRQRRRARLPWSALQHGATVAGPASGRPRYGPRLSCRSTARAW
jgi:hypothetical protein